jgi:hypothetical protein
MRQVGVIAALGALLSMLGGVVTAALGYRVRGEVPGVNGDGPST